MIESKQVRVRTDVLNDLERLSISSNMTVTEFISVIIPFVDMILKNIGKDGIIYIEDKKGVKMITVPLSKTSLNNIKEKS